MPLKLSLLFVLALICFVSDAQEPSKSRKTYSASRINKSPEIDGKLDEEIWKNVAVANNFVMVEPGDGNPIPESHETQVKLLYDDEAIYVGVYLYEEARENIRRQFTQRDNLDQSDFFLMDINTYDDGENQTRFIVTSAGTQADAKITGDREDFGFNVVWESEISVDEQGWYIEMKIPYAALRFPPKEEQQWGVQFLRKITHLNENYVWNYVDKSVGKASQYTGLITGIKNVDPPVRLSFYPFTSTEADYFDGTSQYNFSAGLDLKYGLNESFTLDMTLVPDFGQTAFDEVELNLGPFEQVFGENRAFFTEGTELFNKGGLFFSRRVGDSPIGFNEIQRDRLDNEQIVENPEKTDLLNALKVSGRTNRGLGVGFFNAITGEAKAILRDTLSGRERMQITEPVANYNILVLDQQFNQNSSITLINTNVIRNGHFRDGNVTAFLFDVFNKENSFNFEGQATMSHLNLRDQSKNGFASELSIENTKGNFRYGVSHRLANETYDINDLGLNFRNNHNNFSGKISYQIFEPTNIFNNYRIELFGNHQRRYRPDIVVGSGVGMSTFFVTKERFAFGGSLEVNSKYRDFFEPRRENRFITYNSNATVNAWVSSDYRKKFAYGVRFRYQDFFNTVRNQINLNIEPRFRFNEKFLLIYGIKFRRSENRISFVDLQPEEVIFANRDQKSVENSLQANYNFNTKQAINLSFRHFWSTAEYADNQFLKLKRDGSLQETTYNENFNPDANFGIWNLDLSYRWRFAPGSEAILLYRNALFNQDKLSALGFQESLDNLFMRPSRHNISLRVVYYIDYNQIKNLFSS